MTKLLTSVRNLAEAKIAKAGGSDWLDLKEPNDGALGAVPIADIVEITNWSKQFDAPLPISATIGDRWADIQSIPQAVSVVSDSGVDFIKIGIYADSPSPALLAVLAESIQIHSNLIVLCFAERPPPIEAIHSILDLGVAGMMLDTAVKGSGRLTEKMTMLSLQTFTETVKKSNKLCGLAGSLTVHDIALLVTFGVDYLGFRGALCRRAERVADISLDRVQLISDELRMQLNLFSSTGSFKKTNNRTVISDVGV